MVKLELSERSASYLADILDMWLEGFEGTAIDIQNDRSFEEAEDMLIALDDSHRMYAETTDLRDHLRASIGGVDVGT